MPHPPAADAGDPPDRGGIIRVNHDRTHPYMIAARAAAQDKRLSFAARGLLWYLLSKPDDWEVRFTDLLRQSAARSDKLRNLLKELEAVGYLHRERTHGPDGRWRWVSTVYEVPYADFPYMAKPEAESPEMVDRQIKEIESLPNPDGLNREDDAVPTPEALERAPDWHRANLRRRLLAAGLGLPPELAED